MLTLSVTPSGSKVDGISKLSVGPLMAKTAYFLCPSYNLGKSKIISQ